MDISQKVKYDTFLLKLVRIKQLCLFLLFLKVSIVY